MYLQQFFSFKFVSYSFLTDTTWRDANFFIKTSLFLIIFFVTLVRIALTAEDLSAFKGRVNEFIQVFKLMILHSFLKRPFKIGCTTLEPSSDPSPHLDKFDNMCLKVMQSQPYCSFWKIILPCHWMLYNYSSENFFSFLCELSLWFDYRWYY